MVIAKNCVVIITSSTLSKKPCQVQHADVCIRIKLSRPVALPSLLYTLLRYYLYKPTMSMTPDRAYSALGLDENTPRKKIRKVYFRLALKHHPDEAKDEPAKKRANEQFRNIKSAYEVLTKGHDEKAQPTIDFLERKQAQPGRTWTEYGGRSTRKTDHAEYGQEDEEEETDDVRYGEEQLEDGKELDSDDPDYQHRSDAEESADSEKGM